MDIPERQLDFSKLPKCNPNTKARFVVIGSGDARVTNEYHDILTKKLSVKNFFYCLNKGMVESLAYNAEKDRAHHIGLLKHYICKKIDTVIVFTEVCCKDVTVTEAFLAKKEKRKAAAVTAKRIIKSSFMDRNPNLQVECYLICIVSGIVTLFAIDEE